MKHINDFLESGLIENYCLGIASPEEEKEVLAMASQFQEVSDYLNEIRQALEFYMMSFKVNIPEDRNQRIKNNILEEIKLDRLTISEDGILSEFITISDQTNLMKLEAVLKDLHPPDDFDNIFLKNLYSEDGRELNLVWVKDIVPMEEHPHLDESFLVLEGTADCYIDGVLTKMGRGDFMRIPPDSHHEVIITSTTPAKAIQCRLAL